MKLYIAKSENVSGKPVVLDDMILTKDMPTSAGSKMLDGYMSLFDAEIISKLKDAGFGISGKANVGEMGIDLLGETSFYGECEDSNGNLAGAAAEIVKSGEAVAAIGMDVCGSTARAAAMADLVYIKPTYGTVSRFGVIPAACSGECVSVSAKTVFDCREILSAIAGHSDKDGTSLPEDKCALLETDAPRNDIKKIAIAKALVDSASDEVKALVENFKANATDVEFVEIEAKELTYAQAAWNILMSAEVCNNVSRYDGVKYGHRAAEFSNIDELYTNSRTEAFGYLLKSTILFGSETLSEDNYMKVYDKALRVRRVIVEYFDKLFADFDAVLMPVSSKTAYTKADTDANTYIAYDESLYTAPASITGLPRAVVGGVQLVGRAFSENSLLDLVAKVRKEGK
ncbi:MAG: amidase family protein [Clostridia bacterium]|nr:amidase family protein [Clostridia bacterium]